MLPLTAPVELLGHTLVYESLDGIALAAMGLGSLIEVGGGCKVQMAPGCKVVERLGGEVDGLVSAPCKGPALTAGGK